MSSDIICVRKIIRQWDRYSAGLIIIGGPITADEQIANKLKFDFGVLGEGELSLRKLLSLIRSKDLVEVKYELMNNPGFIIKDGKSAISTGLSENLNRDQLSKYIPSIKVVVDYPIYWASRVYVEVVRGCSNFYRPLLQLPNGRKCINCKACFEGDLEKRLQCPVRIPPGCGYCSVPAIFGPARSKHISSVVTEVKELIKSGVNRIVLSAPDFLDYGRDILVEPKPLTDPRNPPANIEYIEELLTKLTSISEIDLGEVTLMIENIKPNLVTEKVAKVLGKYLKGTTVHLGIETGDEDHLKLLGRPHTVDEAIKAISLLRRYGLRPYTYFIHGLPGQNTSTIGNTIRLLDKLSRMGVEKITIYRFRPLPKSAFEDFPHPPPAIKDKLSFLLHEKIKRMNSLARRKMYGNLVRVIAASRSIKYKGYIVTYPVTHGPVILVKGNRKLIGKMMLVKIEGEMDERTVKGRIIKIIKACNVEKKII